MAGSGHHNINTTCSWQWLARGASKEALRTFHFLIVVTPLSQKCIWGCTRSPANVAFVPLTPRRLILTDRQNISFFCLPAVMDTFVKSEVSPFWAGKGVVDGRTGGCRLAGRLPCFLSMDVGRGCMESSLTTTTS